MPLTSMTGFAREHGYDAHCSWTWELKSVNGKGRDVRFRLPPGLEELEAPVRERVAKTFQRGHFYVNLSVTWTAADGGYRINTDLLDRIIALVPDIQDRVPDARPPSVDGLLGLRGIIEVAETGLPEDSRDGVLKGLLDGFDAAISALAAMRGEEGARLHAVMADQLNTIEALQAQAAALAATQPDALRKRLADQIAQLVADTDAVPEDRLAQEAAILMTKADIREELDRLTAHVAAARDHMAADGAVGRKLDFLCQEFNREANTLCSKSWDTALTAIGLELKAVIDQYREQVQNIE